MLIIYGALMAFVIYVAANYVLPVNKDTPGSDELFDQVILQELIPHYGPYWSKYLMLWTPL